MDFNYRCKVAGYTVTQLLQMGFSINLEGCVNGEFWVLASSGSGMRDLLSRNNVTPLTQPEAIRG